MKKTALILSLSLISIGAMGMNNKNEELKKMVQKKFREIVNQKTVNPSLQKESHTEDLSLFLQTNIKNRKKKKLNQNLFAETFIGGFNQKNKKKLQEKLNKKQAHVIKEMNFDLTKTTICKQKKISDFIKNNIKGKIKIENENNFIIASATTNSGKKYELRHNTKHQTTITKNITNKNDKNKTTKNEKKIPKAMKTALGDAVIDYLT